LQRDAKINRLLKSPLEHIGKTVFARQAYPDNAYLQIELDAGKRRKKCWINANEEANDPSMKAWLSFSLLFISYKDFHVISTKLNPTHAAEPRSHSGNDSSFRVLSSESFHSSCDCTLLMQKDLVDKMHNSY
jgi:hypothetical protein